MLGYNNSFSLKCYIKHNGLEMGNDIHEFIGKKLL